jgi:translation initiation factor 2-alpha kinase 4
MVDANEAIREEELVAVRSIYGVCASYLHVDKVSDCDLQKDWHDIPPVTTKWGTQVEEGWWGVTVRAEQGRVSVQVRGRLAKVILTPQPCGLC